MTFPILSHQDVFWAGYFFGGLTATIIIFGSFVLFRPFGRR